MHDAVSKILSQKCGCDLTFRQLMGEYLGDGLGRIIERSGRVNLTVIEKEKEGQQEIVRQKISVGMGDGNICKIRRTETRYLTDSGYVYDVKEFPKSAAGVRNVIIPDDYKWLCDKISMLNPDGEYICTDDTGKRMTTNCFRRREERNCKKLGIFCKSPHKIRKTYGSILLDNNVDKRLIEDVMGHSNISVTEGHYHRNRKTIDRKSIILSSIPEFQS